MGMSYWESDQRFLTIFNFKNTPKSACHEHDCSRNGVRYLLYSLDTEQGNVNGEHYREPL